MASVKKGTIYEENLTEIADAAIIGGRAVVFTPGGLGVSPVSVAGTYPLGVAMFDQPTIGAQITICHGGLIRDVEAGAAITDGAFVSTDNLGRAIPYVPGSGIYIWGQARTPAVNPGDFFELLQYEARGQ